MKISCITLLLLLIFSCCEPKEDEKPIIYYDFEITVDPENAGRVEVYDLSDNTLIEATDSLLEGTKVKLKAIPNAGYSFSGFWNNDNFIPEDEPIIIIQRENSVKASFRMQSGSPVKVYGQLGINGAHLVDANGAPVQLRGMSLFWSQWIGKYYNASVVEWLANDWEANIIRASMGVDQNNTGYIFDRTEKDKVETVVDAAIETGIYVLIDWHSHHAENYTDEAVAFFSEMAKKYGEYPNVVYEIYNEPLAISWTQTLKPYAEKVIAAIRKEDSDNIIVVGTPNWSQNVDDVIGNEIAGDNIAYTFHFYASEPSHDKLFDKATKAINAGIPLFVTEWGVSEASGNGNFNKSKTQEWIDFMDTHKLSWCNWSVADKDETSAALNPGANANGGWDSSELSASGRYVRNELLKHKGYSAPQ